MRLQHRQIAKLVLLDEDEEEDEGDDADDHEEDARKEALVRLGAVHLIVVLLVVGHVVVGTVTGGDVTVDWVGWLVLGKQPRGGSGISEVKKIF